MVAHGLDFNTRDKPRANAPYTDTRVTDRSNWPHSMDWLADARIAIAPH